jgi:CheY-like chemotaxis protein
MSDIHILMADDDEEICEEMSEILQMEGYKVTTVFNGLDAKLMIDTHSYDLVLMDLKMPGLDGFEVLKMLKEKDRSLKAILITGRPFIKNFLPGEENAKKNKRADILDMADGFINKPFDIETVLSTIKKILTQSAKNIECC